MAPALLGLGLLAVSACGMNVQTNQPYTPGEGVNVDVAASNNAADVVHVRNLGILARSTGGEAILSGTLIGSSADALTAVSGTAIKTDGSNGAPLVASLASPVEVGANTTLVLTTVSPLVTLTSADLSPGLDAVLTLQFRNAGSVTIRVPVINGDQPQYASITPAPTSSAGDEASPSSSATP